MKSVFTIFTIAIAVYLPMRPLPTDDIARIGRFDPLARSLKILQTHVEQLAVFACQPPLQIVIHRLVNSMASRAVSRARELPQIVVCMIYNCQLAIVVLRRLLRQTVARIIFESAIQSVGLATLRIALALRQQISRQIVFAGRAENLGRTYLLDLLDDPTFIIVIIGSVVVVADSVVGQHRQFLIDRQANGAVVSTLLSKFIMNSETKTILSPN